jgi:tellurite methyltransferase
MKNIIGENIARYRKEKGLTQEEVAKQLNITCQAVSKWENGYSSPDVSLFPCLASILL